MTVRLLNGNALRTLIMVACAGIVICSGCKKSEFPAERFVISPEGLAVREAPSMAGAVTATIPFGTRVTLLDASRDETEITIASGARLRSKWFRLNWNGRDGWVFGAFTGMQEDYARERLRLQEAEAMNVVVEFRTLMTAPRELDHALYYPGGGEMEASEMYFMRNGLLVVDSGIFSQKKEPRFFRYEYGPDRKTVTIGFIDTRTPFADYVDTEKGRDYVERIDEAGKSIIYRVKAGQPGKAGDSVCFLGWCFFRKD
jgi:hypothetical protein